jgi:hypothetical protein
VEQNAMDSTNAFLTKYTSRIAFTLDCFDRVIFKGHVRRFCFRAGVRDFVDYSLRIPRIDFMPWAKVQSQRIVDRAHAIAAEENRPYIFLRGARRKDELVDGVLRENPVREGLVCVLGCVEHCPSFKLIRAKDRPDFVFAMPPAQVFYFYWLDPRLGLIHVRVPTLFPWSIQVAVNGHDHLARQLSRAGIGFVQEDNTFVELDDPARAQQLADRFIREDWPRRLRALALRVLPPLSDVLVGFEHYWVVDQAEHATDVVFSSRDKLAELFPRLLDHAVLHFQAADILGFLGRRLYAHYDGDVFTNCKKERIPGVRIKHRVRNNWIKMYNKRGRVLRVETVINNPREFRVRRKRLRNGVPRMVWSPMNKGVCNLYQYQQASRAANARYLAALAPVEPPPEALRDLHRLGESCQHAGRGYAGFNPARPRDLELFQVICQGQHLLRGFRNADIREPLFGQSGDPPQQRRRSAATGRLLKRLHVRGLVLKIPHTRRWHLSQRGRELLTELLHAHRQFVRYSSPPEKLAA